MKHVIYVLTGFLIILLLSDRVRSQQITSAVETGYSDLSISPDGKFISFSDDNEPGLYILNLEALEARKIASGTGPSHQVSWSSDHKYLGFKYFVQGTDGYLQAAALLDLSTFELRILSPFSTQIGVPCFTPDNKCIFTSGRELHITDLNGTIISRYPIPAYANLTPVSPDGRAMLLNDDKDRLYQFDLLTGELEEIPLPEGGYFKPVWSPSGKEFMCQKLTGELFIVDVPEMTYTSLGIGQNADWSPDGSKIVYTHLILRNESELESMQLVLSDRITMKKTVLTNASEWSDFPVLTPSGTSLFYSDRRNGKLIQASLVKTKHGVSINGIHTMHPKVKSDAGKISSIKHEYQSNFSQPVYFDIPYLNQVYDPPTWFNGFWACGGTSAVMCLAYYGLLDQWPLERWVPSFHISDFSRYICEKYTYDGYTFNTGGADPDGTTGYGAYGYIIQNNWQDTKGNMAKYAIKHGLESSVDWSPSRQKSMIESDLNQPFVLLNSLTSSGHYISIIGYENDATTLIVNDPYGNKNIGYYNYYGRRVKYDWPGYSNGYSNLNTVHCFIYFRGELTSDLVSEFINISVDSAETGKSFTLSGRISNQGANATPAGKACIFLSTEEIYRNNSVVLKEIEIPEMAIGDSCDIEAEVTLPDSIVSNNYYVGIYADADSLIGEMLEDNNSTSFRIPVNGYPNIYGIYPENNAILDDPETRIYATFGDIIAGIDKDNIQFILDENDVTEKCTISLRKSTFIPEEPLAEGLHNVRLIIPNQRGYVTEKAWSFTIDTGTKLERPVSHLPETLSLSQNYPNPFNGQTRIQYSTSKPGFVDLTIFDASGAEVANLTTGYLEAGQFEVSWNGTTDNGISVSSGLYYYRLKTTDGMHFRRMLYLK